MRPAVSSFIPQSTHSFPGKFSYPVQVHPQNTVLRSEHSYLSELPTTQGQYWPPVTHEGTSLNSNLLWECPLRLTLLCWCSLWTHFLIAILTRHTGIPTTGFGPTNSDAEVRLAQSTVSSFPSTTFCLDIQWKFTRFFKDTALRLPRPNWILCYCLGSAAWFDSEDINSDFPKSPLHNPMNTNLEHTVHLLSSRIVV